MLRSVVSVRRAYRVSARWMSDAAKAPSVAVPVVDVVHPFFKSHEISALRNLISGNESRFDADVVNQVYQNNSSLCFDPAGAVYLLRCIAKFPGTESSKLLTEVIRVVEDEYFSGNPDWLSPTSPYSQLLVESGQIDPNSPISFRTMLHSLPLECKAAIMAHTPERPVRAKKSGLTKDEIEARWHNLDPVDMETVEREHFLKTKQLVRTRHVQAKPSPAPVGSRLRQILGLEFLDRMESLNADEFVLLSSSLLNTPTNSVFHRDVKMDAQFRMCKKIMSFTHDDVARHLLPISLLLGRCEPTLEIPSRVWNRTIIPVIRSKQIVLDQVPAMYNHLDDASRWALLTATILSSGRVKATPRLLSYLTPKFLSSIKSVDPTVTDALFTGLVQAGVAWEPILGPLVNPDSV